jgi:type I restriction enzyme S subunit
MTLGEACEEGGGFIRTGPFGTQLHQSDYVDDPNGIPVVMPKDMSDGRIDLKSIARIDKETALRLSEHLLAAGDIVLSRRGDVGRSAWVTEEDLPALCGTGSMRIHPGHDGPLQSQYLRYVMRSKSTVDYLEGHAVGATMPNLNAGIVAGLPLTVLSLDQQKVIGEILSAIDDLIENIRRRIELLERMAQALYREWFIYFRYPGYEEATLVDSSLGLVPKDWDVVPVSAIASSDRNAVTGGPFGSKLGRKDYVDEGVPVVRGTNLRLGGGFDEADLVFVTEEKANELRSSLATPGDILVTQRGTLGQVGLIPHRAQRSRYLLSQSQMKITIDPSRVAVDFVYAQFRTAETTSRFIAMAMSSGVPHVNLKILRDFELLVPPRDLQGRFAAAVAPLSDHVWILREKSQRMGIIRDLLLPKLVSAQIYVSILDFDAVSESVA